MGGGRTPGPGQRRDGRTRTQGRLSPEAAANFGRKKEWKGHNRETCDRKTKKTGDEKKDAKLPCTCGLPEPLELLYVKQPGLLTTPSPIILTEGASSADHVLRREMKVGGGRPLRRQDMPRQPRPVSEGLHVPRLA